jgi:hypothetical protein
VIQNSKTGVSDVTEQLLTQLTSYKIEDGRCYCFCYKLCSSSGRVLLRSWAVRLLLLLGILRLLGAAACVGFPFLQAMNRSATPGGLIEIS